MVVVLAVCLVGGCGSARPGGSTRTIVRETVVTQQSAPQKTATLASVINTVKSGVVRLSVDTCNGSDVGTGLLLSRRLLATVEHVVDGASTIRISQGDRQVATGTIVGADPSQDLALVLTNRPIQGHIFTLAPREPPLGSSVAAIGFPLDLPLSVTQGTVSGLGRQVSINGYDRKNLIQTDASVNPGNSGGPLILVPGGDVVGLVDLGTNLANGLGFAVSAAIADRAFAAWEGKPQPVRAVSCASTPATTAALPPSALPSTPCDPSVCGAGGGGTTTSDSGNPCDPASSAYDPSVCTGTTTTDSGNPCDPSSSAYDPSACSGSTSTTTTDSGDPCDPNSVAYDPSVCSSSTTGTTTTDTTPSTTDTTPTPSTTDTTPTTTT
jgi:hypothetical protein